MKVKFLGEKPTSALIDKFSNEKVFLTQDLYFDLGDTYLVVALLMNSQGGILVDCLDKYSRIRTHPIDFFEIVDPRVSKYWIFKIWENGDTTFYPDEYYEEEYFHDDLSENVPSVLAKFHNLIGRLREESV